MGIRAYPSLLHFSESVDLAVIVLPAEQVPKTIMECAEKRVKGIVLITAGFKEIEDQKGLILQEEISALATRSGIRIIGPNTFGIVNLHLPLNASFTPEFSWLNKGEISLVSQSGGMSHLMGFLSLQQKVGMSKIIGLGNRCNLDFAQTVEYLLHDDQTKVIALYMEGIDFPKRMMEVAKGGNRRKPILAYKVGRSSTSDKASQFHTGSLAGKHEIYKSAFRQAGILAVTSSEELLDTAKALATCPLPEGDRVAVLSGQAGPGMAACDICEMEGLRIPSFSVETQKRVDALIPPLAIRTNPVDMGPAWYDSQAIKGIVQAAFEDEKMDAILLCLMFASANRSAAGTLADLLSGRKTNKPILCCLSSPPGIWEDEIARLQRSGVPNYPTPERAAKAMVNLYRYTLLRGGK